MNPSKKNKLFDKYMAGDISQDEMHELNQYALEDDFLFEALEGSAGFEPGNKNAIEELNQRLKSKNKKKRSPLFIWASIAATIALLIIAFNFIPDLKNETLSDVMMETEAPILPNEDDISSDYVSESEPEVASKKEEFSPPPAPPAAKPSPEPARSQKTIIASEVNDGLNEESNDQIAFKVQPEEEKDIEPLGKIALADTELKNTESSEIEIKRREIQPAIAGASSEKAKQSAPQPSLSQARNKKVSSRNAFLDQEVSEGAQAERLEEDASQSSIIIQYDVMEIALIFQEYINQNFNKDGFSGMVNIEMTINDKQEATKINIKTPLNSSHTRKIMDLVESFKEWGEAGNKTLRIMFTK